MLTLLTLLSAESCEGKNTEVVDHFLSFSGVTLAPCYAIKNMTLKDTSVVLVSSLPLATTNIRFVLENIILCLLWKI